jgi:hypothetical protein
MTAQNQARLSQLPVDAAGWITDSTVTWPIGPVCDTCYSRTKEHPAACAACSESRVLIARDAAGQRICGPCAGSRFDYRCRRCGAAGRVYAAGNCFRCCVETRLRELLADSDGQIPDHLRPLTDAYSPPRNHAASWSGWARAPGRRCWPNSPRATSRSPTPPSTRSRPVGEPGTHPTVRHRHERPARRLQLGEAAALGQQVRITQARCSLDRTG